MNWHRLFGLILTDFFTGSPYRVEMEKDLSLKQQFLDVVIIRKESGTFDGRLPDGLDNLADHNLISFKYYHEALEAWTIKELIGHYVNYRKQTAPTKETMLPEDSFRLYGVCARYPKGLASQAGLEELQRGVYQCHWGTDIVRVVVLRDLPHEEHNAPLHLFSAMPKQVQYGQGHYRQHSAETSTLINKLLYFYNQEGVPMPYTMEDFRRDYAIEGWEALTPEYRELILNKLTPEDRQKILDKLSPEDLRKALDKLSPTEIERYLTGLPMQDRKEIVRELLKGLPPDEIAEYLPGKNGENPDATD